MSKKKEKQVIRERRFRLILWSCDDDFNERKEALCELAEFNVAFTLNSIPVAKTVPLLGEWINTKKPKRTDIDKVLAAAKENIPVIVTVQLAHSFSTLKNKAENEYLEKKYWPKGSPDAYGIYKSEPVELFQGYLQPPATEVTAIHAGITLPIVHWLADLADMSLYTSACQLGTVTELALQMYNMSAEAGKWLCTNKLGKIEEEDNKEKVQNKKKDQDKKKKTEFWESVGDIWEKGIKVLFKDILERSSGFNDNKGNFVEDVNNGHFYIKKKRQRLEKALDRIVPDETLKLKWLVEGNNQPLSVPIQRFIGREEIGTFVGTSAWHRLIGVYSPAFLFSISPRVTVARLIPTPCTIDKDRAREISSSQIIQVRSSPIPLQRIAKIICVPPTPVDPTGSVAGPLQYHDVGHYPHNDDMKNKTGLVQTIMWPEWIQAPSPESLQRIPKQPCVFENPAPLKEDPKKKKQKQENSLEDLNYVGAAYARYAYLVSSYNTTTAVLVTSAENGIAPGAMVKYHTRIFGEEDVVMYGTVVSTEYHYAAGENACTTTLTLTNIRTSESIDDKVDNPPGGAGFYEQQYSG